MKSSTLKPFGDGKYISVDDALRELEGLPDYVEADSGKKGHKERRGASGLENPQTGPITLEGRILDIDLAPYSENKGPLSLVQDDWIKKFNGLKRVMVSMPDLYLAGKSENPKLIKSLRDDFQASWEISSTRIIYNKRDLYGKIVHYYGSNFARPVESGRIHIPIYRGVVLDDVLNDREGLRYLQALFGTKDDADAIRRTLKNLGNYDSGQTKVWTPGQDDRKRWPHRAAGFLYYYGGFLVLGDDLLSDVGRSRGVRVSPR